MYQCACMICRFTDCTEDILPSHQRQISSAKVFVQRKEKCACCGQWVRVEGCPASVEDALWSWVLQPWVVIGIVCSLWACKYCVKVIFLSVFVLYLIAVTLQKKTYRSLNKYYFFSFPVFKWMGVKILVDNLNLWIFH